MPLYSATCPLPKNQMLRRHRTATPFAPTDLTGLSLWLKADAGVTTTPETYISQIVISGAGTSTSNGTYTRASGGNTTFNGPNGNTISIAGPEWALYDTQLYIPEFDQYGGDSYYTDTTFSPFESWYISGQNYGASPAPSGVVTNAPTGTLLVNGWADQSGNGKNATSVVNPAYTASAKNGKPAITFSGAELMTTANIFNGANARTIFAVYYVDNNTTPNTICGQTNDVEVVGGSFFLLQARSDLNSNPYLASADDDLSGSAFVNQVWKISMADYDGTTANLYSNGTNVGTNEFSWNTHNGTFCIGSYFTNDDSSNLQELLIGEVAEIVVYNRVLTTPERQQVEAYLNAKYSIY